MTDDVEKEIVETIISAIINSPKHGIDDSVAKIKTLIQARERLAKMEVLETLLDNKDLQYALFFSAAIEPNDLYGNDYYQNGYKNCSTRTVFALKNIIDELKQTLTDDGKGE